MIETISDFFLETVGREWCVFFCSLLPIIELRGSIPLGTALGLPWWENYLLSVVGNFLPVPVILLCIRAVLRWMQGTKLFGKLALWLQRKADEKSGKIEKYEFLGLWLFVAIPLPGTGAWTGSLIAALLKMDFKKSLLFVFLGILTAGVIMTLGSYGVVGFLKIFA